MQAIILAGGFGTRLQSVVSNVPKPMAPIGDKPFLAILLDDLEQQGFSHVVLAVHHLKEKIIDYFSDYDTNLHISYAIEKRPLGTGGAIVNALQHVDFKKPIFVINGDTFVELNYTLMLKQYMTETADFCMAVHEKQNCSRYGTVIINDDKNIIAFEHSKQPSAGLINAGIYLFSYNLLQSFQIDSPFSFEQDFLYPVINQIKSTAFLTTGYFIDIGIPEDYHQLCSDRAL